jgi:hypothetical protein
MVLLPLFIGVLGLVLCGKGLRDLAGLSDADKAALIKRRKGDVC